MDCEASFKLPLLVLMVCLNRLMEKSIARVSIEIVVSLRVARLSHDMVNLVLLILLELNQIFVESLGLVSALTHVRDHWHSISFILSGCGRPTT